MAHGVNGLIYLDLEASAKADPIRRSLVERRLPPLPPARCFSQHDLYTTMFGGIPNDEIERLLFGSIDNDGANAVRAFASNDLAGMTRLFREFFDYISVQKLRTPKGLDWIKANYPKLSQIDLMTELQALRQMNCTMWFESVREIVSAEDSETKFIVSDHPITTYNRACGPGSPDCVYPYDPPIDWKGTHTLFALDADRCLILTNLEYARDPSISDLTSKRTHARHYGEAIARTDNTIRVRKIARDEVIAINRVLRLGAKRYIGANNREWLDQAGEAQSEWARVGELLLPPKSEMWHFGGTIYVGFADGTSKSWDEFGRAEPPRNFLMKDLPTGPLDSANRCGCGSGRTFGECCEGRDERDRPSWEVWSIRERNLRFHDAITRVLGLDKGKTWTDVRRELSGEQVKTIHHLYEGIWPPDTDIASLLPRPDPRVARAMYTGVVDPRSIAASVTSWLPYFDEIIVINPFVNAREMKPEFSPVTSPDQHKAQTLKNVMLLMTLEPFIAEGWVHLVPDPTDFNPAVRESIFRIGETIKKDLAKDLTDFGHAYELGKDDFERSLLQTSSESLRGIILKADPHIAPEAIERILKYMNKKRENDPLALLQGTLDQRGGELHMIRGVSVPIALFLCHLSGAVPYTDIQAFWNILNRLALKERNEECDATASIAAAMSSNPLPFETNPNFSLRTREILVHREFRRQLRGLLESLRTDGLNQSTAEQLARQYTAAALAVSAATEGLLTDMKPSLRFRRELNPIIPVGGFSMNEVHRLLLTFGHRSFTHTIPIAMLAKSPARTP